MPVAQTYGLTEATSQVTVSAPGEAETAGLPLAGVDVRLAADGEILVEGPIVAGGGVLRTGDLGRLDEQGRLTVIGRKADTIVTRRRERGSGGGRGRAARAPRGTRRRRLRAGLTRSGARPCALRS